MRLSGPQCSTTHHYRRPTFHLKCFKQRRNNRRHINLRLNGAHRSDLEGRPNSSLPPSTSEVVEKLSKMPYRPQAKFCFSRNTGT